MNGEDDLVASALRRLAGHLDVAVPPPPTVEPARRWVLKVSAGVIAIVGLVTVGLVVGRHGTNTQRIAPTVPSTVAAPTVVPDTTSTTVAAVVPVTEQTTTVAPTTEPLTRPVIDMPGCTTTWAREASPGGRWMPYTRSSSKPVAIQVFAGPSASINDPYVIVERFFDDQRTPAVTKGDDVNGQLASVIVNGQGGGQVEWRLADGSEVYIRDHLFDKAALLEIARSLNPRPADAVVPGFDITAPDPFGLSLLDEANGPFIGSGAASSGCTLASGVELRVVLLRGRAVLTYAAYLDQSAPYPPVMVLADGSGTLAVVSRQAPDEAAAALPNVRQAAAADWQRLLIAPQRDEVDAAIGSGTLAVDQSVMDLLAGRHFASVDEVRAGVTEALRSELSTGASDPQLSAVVMYGNLSGPVVVITKPSPDGSTIATVWFVEIGGTGTDLTVQTVTTGSRCRGGSFPPTGGACE
ncbi:MAG: hypothetical protein ACXVLX_02620 [Ilumatobacteraceae bacterium]